MAQVQTTTKLDAVNAMLSNIGQAPITSLSTPNPMVDLAEQILDEINVAVQSEGWVFNTDFNYPFNPDVNGEILLPDNALSIDFSRFNSYRPIPRNGKLYDQVQHTYTFSGQQKANVVWLFDFETIPQAAKAYVTKRAANLFAMRATGSTEVASYSQDEEEAARGALMEYETQQGDWNIFGTTTGTNIYRGSRPQDVIQRYRF